MTSIRLFTCIGLLFVSLVATSSENDAVAGGLSQSFGDVKAEAEIIDLVSVEDEDGTVHPCIIVEGSFFIKRKDALNKKTSSVSKIASPVWYVVKNYAGRSPDGKSELYLAEGSYCAVTDQARPVGATDGQFIYWDSLLTGPKDMDIGYKFGEKPLHKKAANNKTYLLEAQQLLTDLGYGVGPVDGVMGPRTRQAISAFKAANGIVGDRGAEVDAGLLERLAKAKK